MIFSSCVVCGERFRKLGARKTDSKKCSKKLAAKCKKRASRKWGQTPHGREAKKRATKAWKQTKRGREKTKEWSINHYYRHRERLLSEKRDKYYNSAYGLKAKMRANNRYAAATAALRYLQTRGVSANDLR